jgi:hypothetical protein
LPGRSPAEQGLELSPQGPTGAVEPGFDGAARGAQQLGDSTCIEPFNVPEEKDRAEGSGEALDAGADLGPGLGSKHPGATILASPLVCLGGSPPTLPASERQTKEFHPTLGTPVLLAQTGVQEDAVQPGPHPAIALEGADGLEGGEEGLLDGVGTILFAPEEAAGDGEHAAAVEAHQGFTSTLVAGADPGQELVFLHQVQKTGVIGGARRAWARLRGRHEGRHLFSTVDQEVTEAHATGVEFSGGQTACCHQQAAIASGHRLAL